MFETNCHRQQTPEQAQIGLRLQTQRTNTQVRIQNPAQRVPWTRILRTSIKWAAELLHPGSHCQTVQFQRRQPNAQRHAPPIFWRIFPFQPANLLRSFPRWEQITNQIPEKGIPIQLSQSQYVTAQTFSLEGEWAQRQRFKEPSFSHGCLRFSPEEHQEN